MVLRTLKTSGCGNDGVNTALITSLIEQHAHMHVYSEYNVYRINNGLRYIKL